MADHTQNKATLPLRLRDDLLIADFDGREAVIDSGSHVTIGHGDPLSILGRRFELDRALYEPVLGELNQHHLQVPLEMLVGCDVMHSFDLLFDLPNGELTFSRDSLELEGDVVDVELFKGVPMIPVYVNNSRHRFNAIFDSAASNSFLPAEAFPSTSVLETVEEYHPLLGRFETPIASADAAIGTLNQSLTFCITMDVLRERLAPLGVAGLIGNELFRHRQVLYATRRGRVVFGELSVPPALAA